MLYFSAINILLGTFVCMKFYFLSLLKTMIVISFIYGVVLFNVRNNCCNLRLIILIVKNLCIWKFLIIRSSYLLSVHQVQVNYQAISNELDLMSIYLCHDYIVYFIFDKSLYNIDIYLNISHFHLFINRYPLQILQTRRAF